MKLLILIILSSIMFSCSSTQKAYKPVKSDKAFVPFIENWKINNPLAEFSLKGVQREIPMKFNNRYTSLVGVCVLNNDVNERIIYVNPIPWNQFPNKRERYVNHLLNLCYNENPKNSFYYEVPYYGF